MSKPSSPAHAPALGHTQEIPRSLWKLLRGGHRLGVFLGAGSTRSHLQIDDEQLPTGQRMKDELLAYYFFDLKAKEREHKFREEFAEKLGIRADMTITPEMVWTGIVTDSPDKLPQHTALLGKLFEVNKSVPPAYRYVAWLAINGYARFIATTNFDEKLDQAIKEMQVSYNLQLLADDEQHWMRRLDLWKYFTFAFSLDHFRELAEDQPRAIPVLKLHGTLSHPSSVKGALKSMERLADPAREALYRQLEDLDALIVVGYRANDIDIRDALNGFAERRKAQSKPLPKIYWVDTNFTYEDSRQEILRAFESPLDEYAIQKDAFSFCRELYVRLRRRGEWESAITRQKNFLETSASYLDEHITTKSFEDPVYDRLTFPDEICRDVVRVINAADIQRLRDIKQLSFAHYRYPGATHSRFSHSLGVAYLACRAAQTLQKAEGLHSTFVTDVTIAALVHDAGHGPFGHVLDKLAARLGEWGPHEQKTAEFVDRGIYDLPLALREAHTNSLMVAAGADPGYAKQRNIDLWWRGIVADSALDFDRVDFLLRDLHSIGYPQKLMEGPIAKLTPSVRTVEGRTRLVANLTDNVVRVTVDGKDVVGFTNAPGVRQDIEALFDLYARMYSHVYFARDTVSVMEHMVAKALEIVVLTNEFDPDSFYKYTDSGLLRAIHTSDSHLAKQLIWAVDARRPFVELCEVPAPSSKEGARELERAIEAALAAEFHLDEPKHHITHTVIAGTSPSKGSKTVPLVTDAGVEHLSMGVALDEMNKSRKTYVFVAPDSPLRKEPELTRVKALVGELATKLAPK